MRVGGKVLFTALDAVQPPILGPRILILHQVGAGHGYQLDLDLADFAAHLSWLADNAHVVHLDEALQRRREPGADSLVVLTFDDGYRDVYENAFPLLKERNLPFTVYVTTGPIESQTPLKPRPHSEPLTWDQLNAMQNSGLMTIGAHTHAHADLRYEEGPSVAADLARSDEIIRRRTGVQPTHFAYPYGYWSASADELVRSRYRSATLGASVGTGDVDDLFRITRVPIQLSDRQFFFRRKVARGSRTEERVRRKLSRYQGP